MVDSENSPGSAVSRADIPGNRWDLLRPEVNATWAPHRSVSICVPARDPGDRLDRLLEALKTQTYPHHLIEVVVTDDSSVIPIDVNRRASPFDVHVVRQDVDRFAAGRARDLAARNAGGEVLVFLDVDMVPDRRVVETYLRWFERSDNVVPFGFTRFVDWAGISIDAMVDALRTDDIERLDGPGGIDSQVWRERTFRQTEDFTHESADMFRAFVGATLAVSTNQYEECGGFRDLGVRGVEDIEFGYRLQTNGALLIPDRSARHWHQGGRTMSGERIAEIRRRREPYMNAVLPVGGFRSIPPPHDAPVDVVPQLVVHVTPTGSSGEQLDRCVDQVASAGGSDVEVRVGELDHEFRPAFAQAIVSPDVGWRRGAPQAIVAELIRRGVGTLLVVSADGSVIAEVVSTRALRSVRRLDSEGRRAMRSLFGVAVVDARQVRLDAAFGTGVDGRRSAGRALSRLGPMIGSAWASGRRCASWARSRSSG